ncbi:ATP-binding protein [Desulfamplus magnetovallimortis]|uniref:ATP-binding protein n=1 Tax=Desulfamplus magnetovallimortis TaxID=1246637 RepID=UPI001118907F|nr:AAA family ATPase [Desulfamplus magnetovallimortis]
MKRIIYRSLLEWKEKNDRKPLIIKGARQVGKTYILKKFGAEHFNHCHYINFEEDEALHRVFEKDLKVDRIIQEISFYLNQAIDTNDDLLIMDEIQACPRALTSLKYFSEKMPELAVCSAGSLLGIHLGEASFPVGKVKFLEMFPMNFMEFLMGAGETMLLNFLSDLDISQPVPDIVHQRLWEQMTHYFVVGGLPDIVQTYVDGKNDLFTCMKQVREKQKDLLNQYLADIAKHSGKVNSMHVDRLLRNIPAQIAREQDGSIPKFKFKGVIPGIRGYSRLAGAIDWLVASGLIHKIHIINRGELPFSAFSKENFFKLILFDVGLLGALADLPVKSVLDSDYGTYKGYFAENFAAQEFLCQGHSPLYCWREGRSEVEFVMEINGLIIPIEIKSGWVTQAKSLNVFAGKYQPEYRVIFSGRNLHIDHEHKVHFYPLYLASNFPIMQDPYPSY